MSKKSTRQSLSYPLRLPDEAQTTALRLLSASRDVINQVITLLWPRLEEFTTRSNSYAYKQVEAMIQSPVPHGSRQFRCEAEQAGRILRAQADRKQQFGLILPVLTQGMLVPKTEKTRARKHRPAIRQALEALKQSNEDGGSDVELLSLVEQACNFYLKQGCFPDTYEEMQEIPVMQAAQLSYAGDDGGTILRCCQKMTRREALRVAPIYDTLCFRLSVRIVPYKKSVEKTASTFGPYTTSCGAKVRSSLLMTASGLPE